MIACDVISTGSKGNAVLLNYWLLVDCGVPFKALAGAYPALRLVLLTHIHGDHFNRTTPRWRMNGRRSDSAREVGLCQSWRGLYLRKTLTSLNRDTFTIMGRLRWSRYGFGTTCRTVDINCGSKMESARSMPRTRAVCGKSPRRGMTCIWSKQITMRKRSARR